MVDRNCVVGGDLTPGDGQVTSGHDHEWADRDGAGAAAVTDLFAIIVARTLIATEASPSRTSSA
jgi:hypothetical protein